VAIYSNGSDNGRITLYGKYQDFSFNHIKFQTPIRYTSGASSKQAVGHINLRFERDSDYRYKCGIQQEIDGI
jgi:hypothetical protein